MIVELNNILERVNALFGENITDEGLSLIEDITDTFNAVSESNSTDTEQAIADAIAETENTWREKYRARFFSNDDKSDVDKSDDKVDEIEEESKNKTFDELFTEEEKK